MTPQVLAKTHLSPKDGDLMLAMQKDVRGTQKHHGGKSAGPGANKMSSNNAGSMLPEVQQNISLTNTVHSTANPSTQNLHQVSTTQPSPLFALFTSCHSFLYVCLSPIVVDQLGCQVPPHQPQVL